MNFKVVHVDPNGVRTKRMVQASSNDQAMDLMARLFGPAQAMACVRLRDGQARLMTSITVDAVGADSGGAAWPD